MLEYSQLPQRNSKKWLSLKDFECEVWKDIKGFEGFYCVSNYGRVKSLHRIIARKTHVTQTVKERILKQTKNSNGYCCVSLIKPDNKRLYRKVHVLVAKAFCKNPNNEKCINHKDENKENNIFLNLEYCSYLYNLQYNNGSLRRGVTRRLNHPAKKVIMYNLQMELEKDFCSCEEASSYVGCQPSRINECCNGKRKTAKGHIFRWAE